MGLPAIITPVIQEATLIITPTILIEIIAIITTGTQIQIQLAIPEAIIPTVPAAMDLSVQVALAEDIEVVAEAAVVVEVADNNFN